LGIWMLYVEAVEEEKAAAVVEAVHHMEVAALALEENLSEQR